jgi:tRNA(adenine34) deaminase
MSLALIEAEKAFENAEVPVGALIVNKDGQIVSRAYNLKETLNDPTAHAEILAIREACISINDWRLTEHTLYVTKEPCVMCAGAILSARIGRLVYGCLDAKGGAVDSLYQILRDKRLNHMTESSYGVLELRSIELLKGFFQDRRKNEPPFLKPLL